MRLLAALLCLLGLSAPALAKPTRWIQDHLALDAAGAFGWRAGWNDELRGGFQALYGGGELTCGLEFGSYAVIAGGRVLGGTSNGADDPPAGRLSYLEASGQLGGQLMLSEHIRVELGAMAGRIFLCCSAAADYGKLALLAGGFLRFGVDFLPRDAPLLRALRLWLRLDLASHPIDSTAILPRASMALSVSLGLHL